ncbi:MAG: DUF1294 domain-containing protein [Mycoplasmatales bacterium]
MLKILIIYILLINLLSFLIYLVDKIKAKRNKQRISEQTLLSLAIIGGCYGAIFAMNIFKHKINKQKFANINYLILIFWTIGLIWFQF